MGFGSKTRFCLAVLPLLLGCQSDHYLSPLGQLSLTQPSGPGSSGAEKQDQRIVFNSVNSSNQIRPEWLASPTNFFKLGPGDTIEIEALGEPGGPSTALVGPDGKIYYGLLGGTFVWGLTLTESKDLLEKSLAKYLRVKPEVALTLRSVGSRRVWILGSVQRPGVYPLAAPVTLLEAVSAAGGVANSSGIAAGAAALPAASEENADLENSFVIRDGKLMSVDFSKLLHHGDLSQNVYLQPDDFVYLRPPVSRGDIYVLGAVAGPNIVEYRNQISLVSAISSVGGPVQYAYLSHVAVIRGSLAHPSIATFEYNKIVKGKALDVKLEPGDIVYVPFSPYRQLQQFADQILNQFVSTIAINEGRNAIVKGEPIGISVPLSGK